MLSLDFSRDGQGQWRNDQIGYGMSVLECRKTLKGHTSPWSVSCLSPDAQTLASSSDDGILKLWDASTGECR